MIGIIGGYGNIGIEAADIIKTNSSEMIRVAGRNISKVSQRAKELFASDKWFQIKESSSNEWKDFIKGCRLVLCSAELGNETVECINRIAGELDCPIVYLGINLPKQEAEGKFIYGAGSIPGLSGIIPQYLAQDFDSVASIDFYYGAKGTFTYTAAKDYMDGVFNNSNRSMVMWKYAKKILAQTILFYMNKKGVLLKDIPCTLNQILKCLSVNTDNNDIIYRWIELLKKYNYVTETDGIYVCKIEIYEKGLKYGWEEVEYLWKGKLESPLVLDYIINNIKNWDKLIQKEQQATLLLFEQGEDIYAHALYKETKILQYLNHSLSKKVLGYLHENANATILEIGAGTGATSNKVLSDIRENKFEEHIVYFYTDISRFFLQRAKERYKECDGKIEIPFFYAHGYNVYAMSFRNHGNSERIENVDQIVVKDMVEDLIKTIDMIDGKIILIAHSLGCRIAQMCLEEIYSSIQSVVLITPMPVRNNFLQLLQMSKKQRKNNLEYILFSERLDSERKEYYMSLLDKESKKVEYAMMKRQKKFSIYVRKIPTLVIGSYNDQCVILQAVKDNAKIHTAELKIVDSVCHDMMLDPDWRNIADLIFKFIEKTIDKKSGDNYNDNYVSTQAHQGGE